MFNIKIDSAPVWHLGILLVLCAVLYFPHLGKFSFFNKGEPREAVLVQEMVQHGNWLFPLKRGEEVPSKPPLFHWFAALASIVFQRLDEATVRFPSALFASLGVLSIYLFGRRLFDGQTALLGGIILATTVGYQSEAINARVDMTLTFFMTLTLITFHVFYQGKLASGLRGYIFYFLLGVSVLAKGPIGLILPGMIICVFLVMQRRWDYLYRLCLHKGVLVTLIIGIVWYGVALVRGGDDFFSRQVIHENLARFFVYGEGGSGHQKPFYYYVPYLILEGLPWTLFLPFVIIDWFKSKSFSHDHSLFLMLWAATIFLFFSLSAGKRSAYLLPLFPPLSLLTGLWLGKGSEGRVRSLGMKAVGWFAIVMGFIFLLQLVGIAADKNLSGFLSYVGSMVKPKDQAQLLIVQDALSRAGRLLPFFLVISAVLWFSAGCSLIVGRARTAVAPLSCLSLLIGLVVQGILLPSIAESRSYKPFIAEVNQRLPLSEVLTIYGNGWDYTSVVFYRPGRIPILKGDLRSFQEELRQSKDYFIMSEKEWKKMVAAGMSVNAPELRSRGTGPDGKDPIVLIRGLKAGSENP